MEPFSFEQWLAEEKRPQRSEWTEGKCENCGATGVPIAGDACEPCLRGYWQYDLGQWFTLKHTLYATVRELVRAEFPPSLIRRMVDQAFQDEAESNAFASFEAGQRSALRGS